MGTFGIFSKEKKETLDKGLEKTKENVFKKLSRVVVGKSKVDDEVLDSLEEVFENKEQIEVSRFYERHPKPTSIAVQEWLNGEIYYRNPDTDNDTIE